MQLYKISFPGNSEKVYIGITKGCAIKRLAGHSTTKRKTKIHYAIKKYGNPTLTVLANIDDWELLCLAEIEAIEKYKSKHPHGYNLTDGGEGAFGHVVSNDSRLLISKKGKERFSNPIELMKNSERMKEYISRPGVKERMSESGKNYHKNNPQAKYNQSIKMKEYFRTNVENELIRAEKIKAWWSIPENKEKRKADAKLRTSSKEFRENQSRKLKAYSQTPENRLKMSMIQKERFKDESYKNNIIAKIKASYLNIERKIKNKSQIAVVHAIKAKRPFSHLPKDNPKNSK